MNLKGIPLEEARMVLNLKDPKEGIEPKDVKEVRLVHNFIYFDCGVCNVCNVCTDSDFTLAHSVALHFYASRAPELCASLPDE